ncbi:MAG: hypothetical protein MUO34_10090 [Ignavibacteriaceae bacterium]|nr:hypothetical protein [Ignavibacteriaceae bacterium]
MKSNKIIIGFHNENHDFPSVLWNNLSKVKATEPELKLKQNKELYV